jgi:hypothetical protein
MSRLHRIGQMTVGLGYDRDATLDQPTLSLVDLEGSQRHPSHFTADQLSGLEDVGTTCDRRGPGHQNTWCADASIFLRSTGCRLRRVMMSALAPEYSGSGVLNVHQIASLRREAEAAHRAGVGDLNDYSGPVGCRRPAGRRPPAGCARGRRVVAGKRDVIVS